MTPDELDAKMVYDEIYNTQAYLSAKNLYSRPETKDKAFEMLTEMIKDTLHAHK
jgi:hypothetical protein